MKKLLTLGLALILGAALVSGCGQPNGGTPAATSSGVAGATESETNAGTSDEIFIWEGTVITGLTDKGKEEKSIVIPDTATAIDKYACDSAKMETLVIGANVETIENAAFSGCRQLTSINIPASVKVIGDYAFDLCVNCTSITLSEGLEEIGRNAFSCTGSDTLTLPESLVTIGEEAFMPCSGLYSIYIPAGLENIPLDTFYPDRGNTVYVKEGSWADIHFENLFLPIHLSIIKHIY